MHSYVSYYTLGVRAVDGQSGQKAKACLFPVFPVLPLASAYCTVSHTAPHSQSLFGKQKSIPHGAAELYLWSVVSPMGPTPCLPNLDLTVPK